MRLICVTLLLVAVLAAPGVGAVFQYAVDVEGSKKSQTAFLWIPPEARQVRGVILSGMTLMEKPFSKDPIIRRACAEEQLAIVFLTGGLGRADLPKVLKDLADVSGYTELAVAPMMFVGHSAGGPQAKKKAIRFADRCFGLVQYRGGGPGGGESLPAGIPTLMMVGQFDEFGGRMRREGGREQWEGSRDHMIGYRGADADGHLASLAVEPGAGHFAWSERNAKLLAKWIRKAASARIPERWPVDAKKPPELKKIDATTGWLTPLEKIESAGEITPARWADYEGDRGKAAWHFDEEMAKANLAYHAGEFDKKDQFIKWKDPHWVDAGARFFFLGMDWVDDGRTFEVHPVYRDTYPGQYKGRGPVWPKAGKPVGHSDAPIRVRTVSGPIVPIGNHRFRVAFDNLTPAGGRSRATFLAFSEGDDQHRYTEHVGMMPRGFRGLRKGKAQEITFPPPEDMKADAGPVELKATSDSGLAVRYYVAKGPATVEDGKLKIAEIPQRATFPIEVTVVAHQFGSGVAPKFKTAEPVERTLKITRP
jgi:hypothetical protein